MGGELDQLASEGYLLKPLPTALRLDCYAVAERFYAMSPAERMALEVSRLDNFFGYMPSEQEVARLQLDHPVFQGARVRGYCSFDFTEAAEVFKPSGLRCMPVWPEDEGLAQEVRRLSADLRRFTAGISLSLFDQLARYPRLAVSRFALERDTCSMSRLLLYEQDVQERWSKEHTDYEFIATTLSRERGLEIERPDGTWFEIPSNGDECVVLPGDMMAFATNGEIRAARHRVRFGPSRRLSIVSFHGLRYETPIVYPGDTNSIPFGQHICGMRVRGTPHLERALREGRLQLSFPIPLKNPFSNSSDKAEHLGPLTRHRHRKE